MNNNFQQVTDFLNYESTIKNASNDTIVGYRTDLNLFCNFILQYKKQSKLTNELINNIKLSDLYAFMSYVEKQRGNGSYSKARKVASLKAFFNYLHGKARVIENNPAKDLETPKLNKRQPVYLTLDESKHLLSSMDKEYKYYNRDYCMVTMFLNCGMRVSELCNINISKIKGDTLTIVGKGDKERTVYLTDSCLDALAKCLQDRKSYKIAEGNKDALFISSKGTRINKRSVERIVKKYTEQAGLTNANYTPHKLRHTFATTMYKHGKVDIRSLQALLGHKNISTTQIYTHVDDEDLRKAVKSNPLANICL